MPGKPDPNTELDVEPDMIRGQATDGTAAQRRKQGLRPDTSNDGSGRTGVAEGIFHVLSPFFSSLL